MIRRHFVLVVVVASLLSAPYTTAHDAGDAKKPAVQADAAALLPADALAILRVVGGGAEVERLRVWLEELEFSDSGVWRLAAKNPELVQAQVGIAGLAATAGVDAWKAAGALLGQEAVAGLYQRGSGDPKILIVAGLREPAIVDRLLATVQAAAGGNARGGDDSAAGAAPAKPAADAPPAGPTAGATTEKPASAKAPELPEVRSIGAEFHYLRAANWLIASNSKSLVAESIGLQASPPAGVLTLDGWKSAITDAPPRAIATAYVNLAQIRGHNESESSNDGPRSNPLGGFLAGAWWHAYRNADGLAGWMVADGSSVRLSARMISRKPLPPFMRGFLVPAVDVGWSAFDLPRPMAELSLSRDWAALFSEREALLTDAAASDVANFSSFLATILGGMDFIDDVLPRLHGASRLIAVRPDFSKASVTPSPRMPAVALVLSLNDSADAALSRRLFSAMLMGLTLVNFGLAEERRPTYLLDVDRYRDCRILVGEYPPEAAGLTMQMDPAPGGVKVPKGAGAHSGATPSRAAAPVQFNFAPAAAIVDRQLVLSSSRDLLFAIIDRIKSTEQGKVTQGERLAGAPTRGKAASDPFAADTLDISVPGVTGMLRENREELTSQRMLEGGRSRAEASGEVDALFEALSYFDRARIKVEVSDIQIRGELVIDLANTKTKESHGVSP